MSATGIYVHFPFCTSKCLYCDFNSYVNKNELQAKYLQSLVKEIKMYEDKNLDIDTIFIGGGTPSFMFQGCISTVISAIKKSFNVLNDAEITIEGNPDSITLSKVREWKDSGINRVSVGLQTANNRLLKLIGRPHTKDDYIKAIDLIKSVGINNINTDCLIGLPRQKQSDVKYTLNLVNKLNCSHISVYSLILEENTPLFDLVNNKTLKLPKEEKTLGMYNYAYRTLKKYGFDRYEVSNFAKAGFECHHNQNTWKMHKYLGFGAGAHGFYLGKRYNNHYEIEEYIKALEDGNKPIENIDLIDNKELLEETIMLGLRTRDGIDLEKIKTEFGVDLKNTKEKEINYLLLNNLIILKGDSLIATDLGFTVLNKVILDLV